MKSFRLVCAVAVCILAASCRKGDTFVLLQLYNHTDETVLVETNIVSESSSKLQSFELQAGEIEIIARSEKFPEIQYGLSVYSCISNEDAYVKIGRQSASGEVKYSKEWKMSERDRGGVQLFNNLFLSTDQRVGVSGDMDILYTFTILPEYI